MCIVPIGLKKSEKVSAAVELLYTELQQAGIEVLLDDRNERPGVMFSEMDLIGIPHRVVVGERGLEKGVVEYRKRTDSESVDYPIETVIDTLKTLNSL